MTLNESAPNPLPSNATAVVQDVIVPRQRDLGGFEVARVLPAPRRRTVGPFIFFDQMGPSEFGVGQGIDVRPHPHIGLSTITYLFEGEILHRDSLGNELVIKPGEVNWMTAGRGIVHSERTPQESRNQTARLWGIQAWIALPTDKEEIAPSFAYYPADVMPTIKTDDAEIHLIAGSLLGQTSPVETQSPTLYAEIQLHAEGVFEIESAYSERGIFVVSGDIKVDGHTYGAGRMLVLAGGDSISVSAEAPARIMLLGGEPLDGERYIWWNLVSSRKARIEIAKKDWAEQNFAPVPNETEFTPLPDTPGP